MQKERRRERKGKEEKWIDPSPSLRGDNVFPSPVMHSNSPPQELILTHPPPFHTFELLRGPIHVLVEDRWWSVVNFQQLVRVKQARSWGVGVEETRIVKIQNKSGHYASKPSPFLSFSRCPLTIFLGFCLSTHFSVARFHRRRSFSPFTSIYIVISQPFFSSDPSPLFEIFE